MQGVGAAAATGSSQLAVELPTAEQQSLTNQQLEGQGTAQGQAVVPDRGAAVASSRGSSPRLDGMPSAEQQSSEIQLLEGQCTALAQGVANIYAHKLVSVWF